MRDFTGSVSLQDVMVLLVVGFSLIFATVALGLEYPVLVETLEVSSLGPVPVGSLPLVAGEPYLFEASGVWNHWTADANALTDAEFGRHQEPGPGWQWMELQNYISGTYEQDVLDLIIDNTAVNWLGSPGGSGWAPHTFSPDHIYRYEWVGTGDSVSFTIADHIPFGPDFYGDNSGSLTVRIYTVPEPGALLLLSLGVLARIRRRR